MLVPVLVLSHNCALSVYDTSWCMSGVYGGGDVQGGEGVADGGQQL
jgi:hypothetical protein